MLLVERGYEGGTAGLSTPVVRCLQRAGGHRLRCLTASRRHDLRHSAHVDVHVVETATSEQLLAAIAELAATAPIDVVLPIDEADIEAVGTIAPSLRDLGLAVVVPTAAMMALANDKWQTFEALVAAGIETPRSIRPTGCAADDRAVIERWECPRYVLKPTRGWNGVGVEIHDSAAAVLDAWRRASAGLDSEFLIQEFVPGSDRDASFLAVDGRVVAHTVQEPDIEQRVAYRSALGLRFVDDPQADEVVNRFTAATGWTGVAHLDMRVDERTGTLSVIEVNARYWQTLLGSLAMGVNFPDLHCRIALGRDIAPPSRRVGRWTNTHSISADLGNLAALRRRDIKPVLRQYRDEFAADPRLEASLVVKTLRAELRRRVPVGRR